MTSAVPVSILLDRILKDYQSPDDLLGQDGLLQQLTKALVGRALRGELMRRLGYEKHAPEGKHSGNNPSAWPCLRGIATHAPNLIDTFFDVA